MSVEQAVFRRWLTGAGASVACAAALFGASPEPTAAETVSAAASVTSSGLIDCQRYPIPSSTNQHEGEVCDALIDKSQIARYLFYKFGNNRRSYLAGPARQHFESRFMASAAQTIEGDVDSWTETDGLLGNHVDGDIDLYGKNPIVSNLKADRALVRTSQQWNVYSPGGERLHHEDRHVQNATMCRGKLPGIQHILHEWFVVKFVRDPNFNCIAFDKQHGIKP